MIEALITAGNSLAEALRAENEALAALDLPRAAALATAKIRATDAFAAAHAATARLRAEAAGAAKGSDGRLAAEQMAARLQELGVENRRLLERAIALQARVIETIVGAALPRAAATQGRYGAAGTPHRPPQRHAAPTALALSSRA